MFPKISGIPRHFTLCLKSKILCPLKILGWLRHWLLHLVSWHFLRFRGRFKLLEDWLAATSTIEIFIIRKSSISRRIKFCPLNIFLIEFSNNTLEFVAEISNMLHRTANGHLRKGNVECIRAIWSKQLWFLSCCKTKWLEGFVYKRFRQH